MPRLVVVFDTNVYRSTGETNFRELRRLERSHAVLAYANYGTVVELLSHLSEPESADAASCAAGAARLVEHCTEYDGAIHVIRFMASPLGQVTRFLFGRTPDHEESADDFGSLLGRWVHEPEFRGRVAETLSAIRIEAATKRAAYVEMLWEKVVRIVDPEARQWSDVARRSERRDQILTEVRAGVGHRILASGMVREAAAVAGVSVDPKQEERLVDSVLMNFRTMIEYRNLIVEKLISSGPDMTKRSRANGVFDQVVCGATGALAQVKNCPVLVVTDDGDILEAARRADMRLEIRTPGEYSTLLDQDRIDFDQQIREMLSGQDARKIATFKV